MSPKSAGTDMTANKKVNILIVDDREDGLLALEAVLTCPDYNLIKAKSGAEALAHLLTYDVAVVLLDVQMPEMDGFEVAHLIKKRERTKDLPIIFVTAINKDINYIYQGYEAGAVDYLLKPFDPPILRSKVAVFAELYRKTLTIREQAIRLLQTELLQQEVEDLRRFNNFADSIPHIVWIANSEGKLEYCNQRWTEYSGQPGIFDRELLLETIHPDDREKVRNHLFGAGLKQDFFDAEFRLREKSGDYFWHLGRAVPIKNKSGHIVRWFATSTYIEDQKRAVEDQKFLDEASTLLISSLDYKVTLKQVANLAVPRLATWCTIEAKTPKGIQSVAVAHKDPRAVIWAEELRAKFPPGDTTKNGIGKVAKSGLPEMVNDISDEMLVASAQSDEHLEYLRKLSVKSYIGVPLIVRHQTWGVLSILSCDRSYTSRDLALAQEIGYRASRAIENALLYQDVVDAHTKLQRSNRELEQFAYVASHDLQEPLRMVSSYVQLLEKRYKEKLDADARDFIHFAVEGAQRMQQLISDLLAFSRLASRTSEPSGVDCNEIVARVKNNLKVVIKETDAKVIASDMPTVMGDSTQYTQLFQNLIGNALKFRGEQHPEITINAKKQGTLWVFSVKDNGIGIEPQHTNRIFEIFKRLHSRAQYPGSGIGLAICKKIVESAGGRIWVESDGKNGACFFFTLPAKEEIPAETDSAENAHVPILKIEGKPKESLPLHLVH